MERFLPHLLLISGNGRESGKTLFACSVISNLCENFKIIAFKISPHNHSLTGSSTDIFDITEERSKSTGKDSSRLLAAGANRSFYITATDDTLMKAVELIAGWCSGGYYVVCESGGLRKIVTPELFIIVNRADRNQWKEGLEDYIKKDHIPVIYDGNKFFPDPQKILIETEKWRFRYD